MLNEGGIFWDTYYLWEGDLKFRLLQHDMEFTILPDYPNLVDKALRLSEKSNRDLAKTLPAM